MSDSAAASDADFEAEVKKLLEEKAEEKEFDRLWGRMEELETRDVLFLWMIVNELIFGIEELKASARITKVAVTTVCGRMAPEEFGEALAMYLDGDHGEILSRLAA